MNCHICQAEYSAPPVTIYQPTAKYCPTCRDAVMNFGEKRVKELVAYRQRAEQAADNLTIEERRRLDFHAHRIPEDIRRQRE